MHRPAAGTALPKVIRTRDVDNRPAAHYIARPCLAGRFRKHEVGPPSLS